MKYLLALAAAVSTAALITLGTAPSFPPRVHYVDHDKVAAAFVKGGRIEGGVSHNLAKGDVITIPAKTPHQWKDTSKTGSVGYYAVNFDSN
jgi:hypothetical protein